MSYAHARGRYLAALGLGGLHAVAALGCTEATSPPAPTPAVASAAPSPAPASAPTVTASAAQAAPPAGSIAHHAGPWVPAADPPAAPRRGRAMCPHGPFCVPQPADPGPSPAAAPYQSCAGAAPLPEGIGPRAPIATRVPGVSFDPARTETERASDPQACCYQWHVLCVGGRPLRGPEGPVTAAPARRDDWIAPEGAVDARALAPALREALAAHWDREAAFEHASVAAFARASLALLAVGAPSSLVAATHAAAIDEVEHARLAYSLASAHGGAGRGPGPLPAIAFPSAPSLPDLAEETLLDGCAGEAVEALALREAAAAAEDPAMRAALERIAGDEERHAELAFRTVAWALGAGRAEVAPRLAEAIATLRGELAGGEEAGPAGDDGVDLSAYGVLGEAAQRAIRRRGLAEVVIPCAEAMLAATAG